MSHWVTSSRGRKTRGAAVLAALLSLSGLHPAAARVFLTVDEAVKLAFPDCQVEARTTYLTREQLARAKTLSGVEVPSALVRTYVARRRGELAGTAYFDTHRVRTLPETVMIVVDREGRVGRIEVISFREPEEYLPREAWYGQFLGKRLDGELTLKRGIRPVTGATLTARATTSAVRRALALHQVIAEGAAAKGKAR